MEGTSSKRESVINIGEPRSQGRFKPICYSLNKKK